MAANQSSWAQLRQQARAQETQTETLFHTYSQFASQSDISPKTSEEEQKTEQELNDILEKRTQLLTQLSRHLDSEPQPSALKSTNLSRHREILTTHRTEFSRLKSQISTARDRANLLSNVRSDIATYRASASNPNQNPDAAEADYMLEERGQLQRSHGVMDGVLSQAYAVNEQFGVQRESLVSIQRRITGAAARVPGINGLMQRIGSKKRRDGIILGGFIAVCFLVLLWLW